jgi:hypothetical protein
MKNISERSYRENQNTFYVEFFSENRAVYEIMWANIVEGGRPQMTIYSYYGPWALQAG